MTSPKTLLAVDDSPLDQEILAQTLLAAFPDRVIRRRGPGSRRGLMVGGRGVRLAPHSAVARSELFLGVDVDAGQAEALVRQASAVRRDWLPPAWISTAVEVAFDAQTERVAARKRLGRDVVFGDVDEHFSGNYHDEATILRLARDKGYGTLWPWGGCTSLAARPAG